jgi:hypothetical protein
MIMSDTNDEVSKKWVAMKPSFCVTPLGNPSIFWMTSNMMMSVVIVGFVTNCIRKVKIIAIKRVGPDFKSDGIILRQGGVYQVSTDYLYIKTSARA